MAANGFSSIQDPIGVAKSSSVWHTAFLGSRQRYGSIYGGPVPLVFGRAKVKGIPIWTGPTVATGQRGVYGRVAWDSPSGTGSTIDCVLAFCVAPVTQIYAVLRGDDQIGATVPLVNDGLRRMSAAGSAGYYDYSGPGGTVTGTYGGTGPTWHAAIPGATYETWLTSAPAAWAHLAGTPAAGQAWQGLAQYRTTALCLNSDGTIPDYSWVVDGLYGQDAHPADVMRFLLTDPVNGLGLPGASVVTDLGPDGTAASSYRTYLDNLPTWRVNRALDSRDSLGNLIESLAAATNSIVVSSEGKIKVYPLGDSAIGTYTPAVTSLAPRGLINLDTDEIGTEGIKTKDVVSESSVFNSQPITYTEIGGDCKAVSVTVEWQDDGNAADFGTRRGGNYQNDWICHATHAYALSQILVRRSIYQRRTYSVALGPRWIALEPGDLVSFSDGQGFPALPGTPIQARVTELEEDESGIITLSAVECPAGIAKSVDITPEPPATTRPLTGYSAPAMDAQNTIDTSNVNLYGSYVAVGTAQTGVNTVTATVNDPSTGLARKASDTLANVVDQAVAARILAVGLGGGNLLLNSSFETDQNADGMPDGWGPYNNGSEACTYSVQTGGLYGGKFARCVWSVLNSSTRGWLTNSGLSVYSNSAGVTGLWRQNQWYTVSLWARGAGGTLGVALDLRWNIAPDAQIVLNNPLLSASWQRYVWTIQWTSRAPETLGGMFITTQANTASATLDIDGAQVEEGQIATAYRERSSELVADIIKSGMISTGTITQRELTTGSIGASSYQSNDLQNLCFNPSGESGIMPAGSSAPADGWVVKAGSVDSAPASWSAYTNPRGGAWGASQRMLRFIGGGSAWIGPSFIVNPNDQFYVDCWVDSHAGSGASPGIGIKYFNQDGTSSAASGLFTCPAGGTANWQHVSAKIPAPGDFNWARYGQVYVYGCGAGESDFRDIQIRRCADGSVVTFDAGSAVAMPIGATNATSITLGKAAVPASVYSVLSTGQSQLNPVIVSYQKTAGSALAAGWNRVDCPTKLYDTHNAVTTGASWKFTAPVSGLYWVTFQCGVTWSASQTYECTISIMNSSSVEIIRGDDIVGAATGTNQHFRVTGFLWIAAADYIFPQMYVAATTGTPTYKTGYTRIDLFRVPGA